MCKPQCLVVFVLISINYVNSWDIALTVGDQLEFRNGSKIISEGARFRDLTALAYDAVYNMLLFVDRQSDNASIFSYNLATKKYQPLVKRKSFENIQGIAFDPITSSLFWTDTNEKSIYWKSLKPGAKNDIYGKSLFKMVDEIPRAVAVDSCRGYLYWTNTNVSKPTIERSRFDGTEREVIISSGLYMPVSIAIDQKTKTLYWADDRQGIHYSIDSSDLDGKNVRNIMEGTHHQPNTLAVSKDSLYWVDFGYRSVWQYPKNPIARSEPAEIDTYFNEMPFGIVANYEIPDQTAGVSECQGLAELAKNKAAINDTFHIPIDIGLYCLHGTKIDGTLNCKCSAGYTGERCEIMMCQNYCFNGLCSLSPEGEPKCSCNNGYAGSRCEKNICDGYCLNQGSCSTRGQKPYCACLEGYEGQRCEIQKNGDEAKDEHEMRSVVRMQSEICNCSNEQNTTSTGQALEVKPSETVTANDGEFIETNNCIDGWDPIRDPIIMVLGILSGLLCMGCAVLITTILKLKKRPRIKKRIIVNKNVTPLTARPDQCEITIENCCNMNICETPCFEPRSTIRPTLLDSKPGKEEKKNLIANMEYPDDY